jgi:hypothetical protein
MAFVAGANRVLTKPNQDSVGLGSGLIWLDLSRLLVSANTRHLPWLFLAIDPYGVRTQASARLNLHGRRC